MQSNKQFVFIAGWGQLATSLSKTAAALGVDSRAKFLTSTTLVSEAVATQSSPATELAKELEQLDSSARVFAWSMGGMLALEVAAERPDLVERLVLLSSTPRFCETPDFEFGCPVANLDRMRENLELNPRKVLNEFFVAFYSPLRVPTAQARDKVAEALQFSLEALLEGLDHLRQSDLRSRLDKISVPTIVMHGEDDLIISAECSKYLAREIKGSECHIVPGAGHALAENISPGLGASLRSFLE